MTPDPRHLLAERRRRFNLSLVAIGVVVPPSLRALLLSSTSDIAIVVAQAGPAEGQR